MNSAELRAAQAPLKARYREHPEDATVTLRARPGWMTRRSPVKSKPGRRWSRRGSIPPPVETD